MKILVLLFCMLLGFCLACKDTFDASNRMAQRQQLLATTTTTHTATHSQAVHLL